MVGPVIQGADTLARTLAQASRQLADLTDPGRAAADALAVPAAALRRHLPLRSRP